MESPPTLAFTRHNSTYPAIDPLNPQNDYLSMSGRSILITGASRSIGAATVEAFAQAGASNVVLVGRSRDTLDPTAQRLGDKYQNVKLVTYPLDLSIATSRDCQALFDTIMEQSGIKCIDTLVLNAAHYHEPCSISDPAFPLDDFWKGFEINVRGNFNLVRAFISQEGLPEDATIINTSTFLAFQSEHPYSCGYGSSKMAFLRLLEYVHFDRPSLRVFHFHPGIVRSDMLVQAGVPLDGPDHMYQDADLPANFAVWLASSKANFLNGRTLEAVWDVVEMEKAKDAILGDDRVFRVGLQGRGFVPMSTEE